DDQGHAHMIHESPWVMLAPLVLLAVLSVVGGWVGVPQALGGGNHFEKFLEPVFEHPGTEAQAALHAPSGTVAHGEAQPTAQAAGAPVETPGGHTVAGQRATTESHGEE